MDSDQFFLFIGSADRESATTRIRADNANYRKKLLSSSVANWHSIVDLIGSPLNRGTLMKLTASDYRSICDPAFDEVATKLLDGLVMREHVIFVHEDIFLTDGQRTAAEATHSQRFTQPHRPTPFDDDDDDDEEANDNAYYDEMFRAHFFSVADDKRQKVNKLLRERSLNVLPYRTNVELSVMAASFIDDHERHLLFRFYVPTGRLYAQEFETLLGLFREWLTQAGHNGVRQESRSTQSGQVFEFFNDIAAPAQEGISGYLDQFSSFLESCATQPELATQRLVSQGTPEPAARRLVARFGIQARRLALDLKQRREERVLTLKHELENVSLEVDGLHGDALDAALEVLVPHASVGGGIGYMHGGAIPLVTPSTYARLDGDVGSVVVGNVYNQQFINQVAGPIMQNVSGTVNLSSQAQDLLGLVAEFGGAERITLETSVHEIEDPGIRSDDRAVARGRLKRFLADLSNRGVGVGLDILQKYVEHSMGLS